MFTPVSTCSVLVLVDSQLIKWESPEYSESVPRDCHLKVTCVRKVQLLIDSVCNYNMKTEEHAWTSPRSWAQSIIDKWKEYRICKSAYNRQSLWTEWPWRRRVERSHQDTHDHSEGGKSLNGRESLHNYCLLFAPQSELYNERVKRRATVKRITSHQIPTGVCWKAWGLVQRQQSECSKPRVGSTGETVAGLEKSCFHRIILIQPESLRCQMEYRKSAVSRCARLINTYPDWLCAVIAAKVY